ncbi:hypothetical protein B566_EDAN005301 [Ephemera danica]|nr:hypothetical protein B566_EDAN005301 [Ephemera danica]
MPTLKNHDFKLAHSREIELRTRKQGIFHEIYSVNGDCYRGEWKDDRRHGFGELRRTNGESYIGQWRGDKPHGYGILRRRCGDCNVLVYEGHWERGVPHGNGVAQFSDGSYYEALLLPEGVYYRGEWQDDMPHGLGLWTQPDGSFYEGEVQRGVFHGLGVYVEPQQGRELRGQWRGGRWFTGESVPADPQFLELAEE